MQEGLACALIFSKWLRSHHNHNGAQLLSSYEQVPFHELYVQSCEGGTVILPTLVMGTLRDGKVK